jgi:hypothetical protein
MAERYVPRHEPGKAHDSSHFVSRFFRVFGCGIRSLIGGRTITFIRLRHQFRIQCLTVGFPQLPGGINHTLPNGTTRVSKRFTN